VSTTTNPYGQPALIGGLVMGVLTALPLIAIGNVCCCLWVVSGGLVAAYVFQQNQAAPITPGDGALVGLLAGLIGAVVYSVVSIPISLIVGPMERAVMQRLIEMIGPMPPEIQDALERYGRGEQSGVLLILSRVFALIFWLFIGAIFSTLGGLLGAAVFRKPPPPPGVVDIPPPPPPI
jgi:hypothetical protein